MKQTRLFQATTHKMSTPPLTLTLSPGEREQPLADFLKFGSHRVESVFRSAQKVQHRLAKNWERFSLSLGERAGVRAS